MSAGADKQKDLYVIPALGGSARRLCTGALSSLARLQ